MIPTFMIGNVFVKESRILRNIVFRLALPAFCVGVVMDVLFLEEYSGICLKNSLP